MMYEERQQREWKLRFNASYLQFMRGDRLLTFFLTRFCNPELWNAL